jgi:hypothetical protein
MAAASASGVHPEEASLSNLKPKFPITQQLTIRPRFEEDRLLTSDPVPFPFVNYNRSSQ